MARASLRGAGRWAPLAAVILLAAALAAGCGSADPYAADPSAVPERPGDCNDMPYLHGDPGYVLGFDWHRGEHRYGESVLVHLCASDTRPGTLTLDPLPPGVTASPSSVPLTGTGSGVVPIRLTVARGASGALRLTQRFQDGSGGDVTGPRVVSTDDGWHLEPTH